MSGSSVDAATSSTLRKASSFSEKLHRQRTPTWRSTPSGQPDQNEINEIVAKANAWKARQAQATQAVPGSTAETKNNNTPASGGGERCRRWIVALLYACVRLCAVAAVVGLPTGIIAGLGFAVTRSWELWGEPVGWVVGVSLFLLLPCAMCCASTCIAMAREWFDGDEELGCCSLGWFLLTLFCCLGPLVATCYVAGPNLLQVRDHDLQSIPARGPLTAGTFLQAATLAYGGYASEVPATGGAPRNETSLVFAAGVYVDTGRVGLEEYAEIRSPRLYLRSSCPCGGHFPLSWLGAVDSRRRALCHTPGPPPAAPLITPASRRS